MRRPSEREVRVALDEVGDERPVGGQRRVDLETVQAPGKRRLRRRVTRLPRQIRSAVALLLSPTSRMIPRPHQPPRTRQPSNRLLEKLGDGPQALDIAAGWMRAKLGGVPKGA